MEDGMIPLNSDIGCRRMQNIAYQFDKVHLYVVHPMSQPKIAELNPLIEYPIMAPPIPLVRNETNEDPTSVGPTAENELFGEYDNGHGLGDDETQTEVGQNSHKPELEKETVNVSEPTVEETVNVGELVLGNENDFDFGLGNENEDMAGEKEDSALDVHFGESEYEVGIAGDLDSEVGGNGVNVDLNAEADTVRVEGEVNNVGNQTEVGEGSVRVEGEDNTGDKGKKKKGGASLQKKSKTDKGKKRIGRPKKKQPGQDPVFEDDIIEQLQRSVNIESEARASETIVVDRGLDELDEQSQIPNFQNAR